MNSAYSSMKRTSSPSLAFVAAFFLILMCSNSCMAQLSSNFYARTCPRALDTIRAAVRTAVSRERRMAASLLRLHFHDCFVQGCDASVLITDGGERNALQNAESLRGFGVVDDIKSRVETACPGVVSCADILAVAARDATVAVGGPSWAVKLGRRDSTNAGSQSLAETDLPRANNELPELISLFNRKGFSDKEMVALSGSHTIGQAQCRTFRDRIYNDSSIDPGFASTRRRQCPATGGDSNLAPLDLVTPNSFDNNYFRNLVQRKGLLHSDQVLFNSGSTDGFVREYIINRNAFNADFAAAMVKMSDMGPLTGAAGEIRLNCNVFN